MQAELASPRRYARMRRKHKKGVENELLRATHPLRTSASSWVALRLQSSGMILPRPGCVTRLRLESLFTSLLPTKRGSEAELQDSEAPQRDARRYEVRPR